MIPPRMENLLHKPVRPSPVLIITGIAGSIREMATYLLLILAGTFFGKKNMDSATGNVTAFAWFGIAFSLIAFGLLVQKALDWWCTRFWLENDKLILARGLLVKSRIELPSGKIQTVQLKQSFINRITDTCSISIDSAGSAQPEFVIDALEWKYALALQELVAKNRGPEVTPEKSGGEPAAGWELHLFPLDLAKLCISENHLNSLFVAFFFLVGKWADAEKIFGDETRRFVTHQANTLAAGMQGLVYLLMAAAFIGIVVSSVRVILRYFDFCITQTAAAYIMAWGLFTRHHKTIPFRRVEYVTWSANWLRKKLGLAVLRFHSLADPVEEKDLRVEVPVTRKAMLQQLVQPYTTVLEQQEPAAAFGIQRAYMWRRICITGLPITVLAIAFLWWKAALFWWLPLLWLFYFSVAQWVFVKKYRILFFADTLWIQKGIWGRTHVMVHYTRCLHVSLHTSPWQRRHGYATLNLHLPGDVWTIPYLKTEQARFWADYLTLKMEE